MLNYLRDGTVVLPAGAEARAALRQEAEFYNLAGLAQLLDTASKAEAAAQQAKQLAASEVPTLAPKQVERVRKLLEELDSALAEVAGRLTLPEHELKLLAPPIQRKRHWEPREVAQEDRGWAAQLMAALAELDGQPPPAAGQAGGAGRAARAGRLRLAGQDGVVAQVAGR